MRLPDLLRLALANVRRNRTRSLLTLVGVAVGVAALLALIAYGQALQQNARGEFESLELYNTLRVTSRPNPFGGIGDVSYRIRDPAADSLPERPLTDSLVEAFARTPGVLAAYPEVIFPVQIRANGRELIGNAEAIPQSFRAFPSYRPTLGAFFRTDADSALLLSPSMAERLGYADPETIVGDTITLVTATLDMRAMQAMAGALSMGLGTLPLRENAHRMRVAGLLSEKGQPVSAFFRVLVPLGLAQRMQKVTFFSTIDLLMRRSAAPGGYAAVRVQLAEPDAHEPVSKRIEASGVFVSSFRDQFAGLQRLFLIVDLALGIVGLIALLVATLGIANTMTMNVVERRREIGVMKAVGGEERDVVRLFMAESAALGLAGGVAGVLGGGLVMLAIQLAVSGYLASKSLPDVRVFAPSPGVVVAVVGVSVAVSLLAGLAPARRAARVEPVEALRSL